MILIALLLIALLLLLSPLQKAERIATGLTGLGFVFSLYTLYSPAAAISGYGLHFEETGRLLSAVICFISLAVQTYSLRHLDGQRNKRQAFRYFTGLTISLIAFSAADHLLLMAGGLLLSNLLLVRLIGLNDRWEAAQASSRVALLHLGSGALLLTAAAIALYRLQGHFSLAMMEAEALPRAWPLAIGGLVLLAALTQSAIWPLHRWLIASANAPTPVSAFMHAGLVNGGALLLFKFYPLLQLLSWSQTLLVLLGSLTAVAGTLWMLVQSDVKRTLTCSTMGQMGFMIMQCGLGLLPAAIAHMIWHGFFKASLFLSAGSTVKAASNQSLRLHGPNALPIFAFGLLMGTAGAYIFWQFTGSAGSLTSTYSLLLLFCGITCAHAVMTILQPSPTFGRGLLAAALGLLGATVYGLSVWAVELQVAHFTALPLNALHLSIAAFFLLGWLFMVFRAYLPKAIESRWLSPLYVRFLQSSQPVRSSLNLRRSAYRL